MYIKKCDICKKEIREGTSHIDLVIGWERKMLHKDCGKPIIDFALKKKLFTKEEMNKLLQ